MPLLSLLSLLFLAVPAGAGAAWVSPAASPEVVAHFSYDRGAPYAAGQRRGVDLAVRPGAAVRAVCTGRVGHAGALPSGRAGVSVRCGALTATLIGLRSVAVRRGTVVSAGQRVGAADGMPLRLGARETGDRHGYRDPLALIGKPPSPAPIVAPRRLPPPPRPLPAPAARPSIAAAQPASLPLPAIVIAAGLGLIAAALLVPAARGLPGSLRAAHGLLRDNADLLRQRRAASRARLHDDRGRRAGAPSPPAWGGGVLPHRHR